MIANERGGIGGLPYRTMFPTLRDAGTGTEIVKTRALSTAHLDHLTARELYDRAGRALRRLGPDMVCRAPAKTAGEMMAEADAALAAHNETLRLRFGDPMPSHALDGSGVLSSGVMHQIQDGGKPFGTDAFDKEKWLKPMGVV